jgi:hypothetical protein
MYRYISAGSVRILPILKCGIRVRDLVDFLGAGSGFNLNMMNCWNYSSLDIVVVPVPRIRYIYVGKWVLATTIQCRQIISVVGPHCFQCESGFSIFGQSKSVCGSGSEWIRTQSFDDQKLREHLTLEISSLLWVIFRIQPTSMKANPDPQHRVGGRGGGAWVDRKESNA